MKCPTCGKKGYCSVSQMKLCPYCKRIKAYYRVAFGSWICYYCKKEWKSSVFQEQNVEEKAV